jgi:methionyl aminopeptidase
MKLNATKGAFAESSLITLKDENWLTNQRVAGRVAAGALCLLENEVKQGTTKSLLELDKLAETYIRDNGCTPTFLLYKNFPNSVCISVNKNLVHATCTSYQLRDGDLVSFDLGATYIKDKKGYVGDTALTIIYGEPKSAKHVELVKATKEALALAIASIKIGARLGIIGQTIYACARKYGLSVVDSYGGHGLDTASDGTAIPHSSPFVSNRSTENEGIRIAAGLVIAIEPLFVIGSSNKTKTLDDGWTVKCENICSHEENTVFIHEDHTEVITRRENESHFK